MATKKAVKASDASIYEGEVQIQYTKGQFVSSNRFSALEKDVLAGLMQDDKSYTLEQANKMLAQFLTKEAF
ncbi:hypothetical protein ACE41H_09845 [Paenibacillus enshidis]|uniref:Uncharacterized protein n=1 Tax=Paenibacillus enshidis TaxID=1458439 RepID=A0ABV5AVC8_9BACL